MKSSNGYSKGRKPSYKSRYLRIVPSQEPGADEEDVGPRAPGLPAQGTGGLQLQPLRPLGAPGGAIKNTLLGFEECI